MKYRLACYDFIRNYIEENNGLSPSIREIAKGVGCNSSSTINRTIWKMVDEGLLERRIHTPRSIRIKRDLR